MNIIDITKENFEQEILNCEIPVLVDFWASWCSPCKMQSAVIDEVSENINDVKFCKINVDEQSELADKFNIESIPTLFFIKNGKIENKSVGFMQKDDLLKFLGK